METLAQLAAEADGLSVVIHCFSMPDRLDECLERGYAISFAGNVTYKSAADLAAAAACGCRRSGCWSRPTPPTSPPRSCASSATSRRSSPTRVAFLAELRGVSVGELGATVERNAARVFGW